MISTRQIQVALVLFAACLLPLATRKQHDSTPSVCERACARAWAESSTRELATQLASLERSASVRDTAAVVSAYGRARRAYKRAEVLIEFYAPSNAAALNGRRPEIDDDDAPPPSLDPKGFTRLQPLVQPRVLADSLAAIASAAHDAVTVTLSFGRTIGDLLITDAQAFDAARLEIARVSVLGLAGADASPAFVAGEAADAIEGVREMIAQTAASRGDARTSRAWQTFDARTAAAIRYLHTNATSNSLDQLLFITEHSRAISHSLEALRVAGGVPRLTALRFWRPDAPSVFDTGAFDPSIYAPGYAPPPTPALIGLGRELFFDATLGHGRSCASCHRPSDAFTDGRARSLTLTAAHGATARNTPTLVGASLQPRQFYDERAASLEDQIAEVMKSPEEMASSVEAAALQLRSSDHYTRAFASAFARDVGAPAQRGSAGSVINEQRLRVALAAYVRSLTTLSSRFDRALAGDTGALSVTERRGFDVFMGRGRCATCHFVPLFNGTAPPGYISSDVEVIGVPARLNSPNTIDPDRGRGGVDHLALHSRAFKTPSLRNIERTAPYMHNGVYRTLEQVIDFYDAGGAPPAARLQNRTLPSDSLHLSPREKRQLVAFLLTLTDTTLTQRKP